MRNILWQSDAWSEYQGIEANKTMLKKSELPYQRPVA